MSIARPAERNWISNRTAVLVALVGLAFTVALAVLLDHQVFVEISAVVVAMVYGVYFGFAIKGGSARDLAVESLFIGIGLTTAVLALHYGAFWLAIGLALHGVWDLLHHPDRTVMGTQGVPGWYIPFCAVYDFSAAIAILLIL